LEACSKEPKSPIDLTVFYPRLRCGSKDGLWKSGAVIGSSIVCKLGYRSVKESPSISVPESYTGQELCVSTYAGQKASIFHDVLIGIQEGQWASEGSAGTVASEIRELDSKVLINASVIIAACLEALGMTLEQVCMFLITISFTVLFLLEDDNLPLDSHLEGQRSRHRSNFLGCRHMEISGPST